MTTYKYLIFFEVDQQIFSEVSLWRAVIWQHLRDLGSEAKKGARVYTFKKRAIGWMFGDVDLVENSINVLQLISIIPHQKACADFYEVCELAHVDAMSVLKEAWHILKA